MWKLTLTRERAPGYGPCRKVTSPEDVFEAFQEQLVALDRECFWAVLLNGRNHVQGFHLVSVGHLTATLVHPREVFKAAVLGNAAAVILIHNHPSGDPEPSAEDRSLTERLRAVGEILGIKVLDHVVIGDGRFVSFQKRGLF